MNSNNVLALISDLYGQITGLQQANIDLQQENQRLVAQLESQAKAGQE